MAPSLRPVQDAAPRSVVAIPALASVVTGATCALLLGIWLFDPSLKAFSGATMKVNTALGLIFASTALWLLRIERAPSRTSRRWGTMLAWSVVAVGVLTSFEYLSSWDLGIDQLVADDFISEESRRFPGRMSPIAAACFVLLGFGLVVIDVRPSALRVHPASAFALPLLLVTTVALAGYVYGVSDFYQLGSFTRIAWATALCFLVLGIGILVARPDRGPVRFFTSARPPAAAARRLLPAVVLLPVGLGWLELRAEQQGHLDIELGTAIFAVSLLVLLGWLVWLNARALDATDREREKSEALFRSFFKLGLVGMAQADATTNEFLQVNSKMEAITGYSADELRSMTFSDITDRDDHGRDRDGIAELVAGERLTYVAEKRYVKKDGSVVWVLLNAAAVRDDDEGVKKTVAVVQDITSLKEVQAELEKAVRIRDEFLSIASHELKTPLTALLMQIQSVQRSLGQDPGGAVRAAKLAKAYASGRRLERLINDLLDVSRITAGRLALQAESVDLTALVHDVVENFREAAEKAGSALRMETNGPVMGTWDRGRVEQVLTNLLSNALKYGGGRPVDVSIHGGEGEAVVSVADHGIGIASEKHDRIFERFERGVDAREYGGFGLGLWIAKQVVHASGGSIEVDSEIGEGARFTLRLPM